MASRRQILVRATMACAIFLILLIVCATPPSSAAAPAPQPLVSTGPADYTRLYQIHRVGSFDVAPLFFQGIRLFDVAAPAGRDRQAFPPVAARIDIIQDNLQAVVPAPSNVSDLFKPAIAKFDPDSFHIKVEAASGYPSLVATDAAGTHHVSLLTVTELDAKYNNMSREELARSWAEILQTVLGEALHQRAPGAFERHTFTAVLIVLAAVLITGLIVFLRSSLTRLRSRLDFKYSESDNLEAANEETPNRVQLHGVWLGSLAAIEWLLAWSIVVLWAFAALWLLYQFAATQPLARKIASELGWILIIWFIAGVLNRLGSLLIVRFKHVWQMRPFASKDESERLKMRSTTIARSLDYAKSTLVFVTAIAVTLSALGASTSAVVTLGAAVAFAISFGAQSLVKDFVNGFFILVEDQYSIGDYVTIGNTRGVVDGVTLRITQLRSADGQLVTIPNSQVAVVENWTRNWSMVDYRVPVANAADVDRALQVFTKVLKDIAQDPQWSKLISDPPTVLGVDSISLQGAILLGQLRTSAGMMFALSRELNRRIIAAFVQQGIALGMPISRVGQDGAQATSQPAVSVQPKL